MRCENCNKRMTKADYDNGRCLSCGKNDKAIAEVKRLRE